MQNTSKSPNERSPLLAIDEETPTKEEIPTNGTTETNPVATAMDGSTQGNTNGETGSRPETGSSSSLNIDFNTHTLKSSANSTDSLYSILEKLLYSFQYRSIEVLEMLETLAIMVALWWNKESQNKHIDECFANQNKNIKEHIDEQFDELTEFMKAVLLKDKPADEVKEIMDNHRQEMEKKKKCRMKKD